MKEIEASRAILNNQNNEYIYETDSKIKSLEESLLQSEKEKNDLKADFDKYRNAFISEEHKKYGV